MPEVRMKVAPDTVAYADGENHKLVVEFAIPGAPADTIEGLPLKSDILSRLVRSLSRMGLRGGRVKDRWCRLWCRLIPRNHGIRRKQPGRITRSVRELQEWRRNSFPTWAA